MEAVEGRREGLGLLVAARVFGQAGIECDVRDEAALRTEGEANVAARVAQCFRTGRQQDAAVGRHAAYFMEHTHARRRAARARAGRERRRIARRLVRRCDAALGCHHTILGSGIGMMKRPPRARILGLLRQDLLGEVPGQHQHVVGLILQQLLGRMDRLARARHVAALLEGVLVDEIRHQRGVDTEVVDQRAALGRERRSLRCAYRTRLQPAQHRRSAVSRSARDARAEVAIVVDAR